MQVGTQQCQLSHLRSKVKKAQVQLFVILSCMETILDKHIPAPCMCLPEGHSKPFVKKWPVSCVTKCLVSLLQI